MLLRHLGGEPILRRHRRWGFRSQKYQRQVQETQIHKKRLKKNVLFSMDSNLLLNGGDVVVDLPQGLLDLAVLPLKLHPHLADLWLHLVTDVCWECLFDIFQTALGMFCQRQSHLMFLKQCIWHNVRSCDESFPEALPKIWRPTGSTLAYGG